MAMVVHYQSQEVAMCRCNVEQKRLEVDFQSMGPPKLDLTGAGDNIQEAQNRRWLRQ
jgi:hypothetical protein